jgi:hypothetical protein
MWWICFREDKPGQKKCLHHTDGRMKINSPDKAEKQQPAARHEESIFHMNR